MGFLDKIGGFAKKLGATASKVSPIMGGLKKLGINLPFEKGGRIKKSKGKRDAFTQQYD